MIVVLLVASHQGENPNLTDSPPSFFFNYTGKQMFERDFAFGSHY